MRINRNCFSVYDGVYLQSYTLIIVNVALFSLFKFCFEEALALLFKKEKDDDDEPKKDVEMTSSGGSDDTSNSAPRDTTEKEELVRKEEENKNFNELMFFLFQAAVSFASLVMAITTIDKTKSPWTQYENFYGLILNSSVLTFAISSSILFVRGISKNTEKISESGLAMWLALIGAFLVFLLVLPAIITHIIPALVIYIWVFLCVAAVILIPYGCGNLCLNALSGDHPAFYRFFGVTTEVVFRLICVAFFQTLFNYMYFFYGISLQSPISANEYMGVIRHEYNLRSQTYCSFQRVDASMKDGLVFFSWV